MPPSGEPKTGEHSGSCQSTNQQRDQGGVEVGNGDRRGDCKPHDPSHQRTSSVADQDPAESARSSDGDGDTDDAAEHSAEEEPALPGSAPEHGADYGTETREQPPSEKSENRFHRTKNYVPLQSCLRQYTMPATTSPPTTNVVLRQNPFTRSPTRTESIWARGITT